MFDSSLIKDYFKQVLIDAGVPTDNIFTHIAHVGSLYQNLPSAEIKLLSELAVIHTKNENDIYWIDPLKKSVMHKAGNLFQRNLVFEITMVAKYKEIATEVYIDFLVSKFYRAIKDQQQKLGTDSIATPIDYLDFGRWILITDIRGQYSDTVDNSQVLLNLVKLTVSVSFFEHRLI